ncbi:uncharacterized protein TRIADDRAFT_32928 [Trichoplax adhaerens]|uniref:Golgin subfamily A member 7/ERF4 domain-containing protein n=1 Tax=Trichoplax adhaerens TaxID=10228 RepID=B3SBP8_TRIAD|nr:hypothetical protein TRIADDRAFT_32928 [Trichoplax adhaerens]EDV19797.1 hypothetical protein TRIADDRAFT_32928 [Trichoplax adhaerens]|eukprot:XP_002117667.1 hypothetical protein TRIADDRAFT_32928 [Trichoplax adhaerens]
MPNIEFDVIQAQDVDIREISQDEDEDHPMNILHEALTIRGVGNVTLFGLTNRFEEEFPPGLHSKVAPEEFKATISRINDILQKMQPTNLKSFFCGCICCCCTLGCSLWPVICLSKRTKNAIAKALDYDNNHSYHKLGLHWVLKKVKCDSSNMLEYVLSIEYIPKKNLMKPD